MKQKIHKYFICYIYINIYIYMYIFYDYISIMSQWLDISDF